MTTPPDDALTARLEALSTDALRALIDEVASTPMMFALLERPALIAQLRTLIEAGAIDLAGDSPLIIFY
jgi:hypothetical protein